MTDKRQAALQRERFREEIAGLRYQTEEMHNGVCLLLEETPEPTEERFAKILEFKRALRKAEKILEKIY